MTWFCLVNARYPTLVLQAADQSGQPITLQALDSASLLQHWQLQLRSSLQLWGVAFISRATGMGVSYSGNDQPLLMRSDAAGGHEPSVWYATATGQAHVFRIALASNTHLVWAAAHERAGPEVTIHSRDVALTGDDALWTMRYLE